MNAPRFPIEPARGQILLVETASVFREMQALLLQRAGFAVVTCDDADLALLEAARQPFDLAILDADGAALHRPQFLVALRRHQPSLAVIFVAGSITSELNRNLSSAGISVILQRPVSPLVLVQKIDEALGLTLAPGAPRRYSSPREFGEQTPLPQNGSTGETTSAGGSRTSSASPFPSAHARSPFHAESASPFLSVTAYGHSNSPFPSASPYATAMLR